MDLRPGLSIISGQLGLAGYEDTILTMHPYDVSGAWPIVRDAKVAIAFYDGKLREVKPSNIPVRDVDMPVGFLACCNQHLFEKARTALQAVLG